MTQQNREQWLAKFIHAVRRDFDQAGHPLPEKIRASCGWPSKSALAAQKRRIGEAWCSSASADGTFEVFVSPTLKDEVQVGATLVHELVHTAVGLKAGHGTACKRAALAVGLTGKMTATEAEAGPALAGRIKLIVAKIGGYPHAELKFSNAPKKQTTRLIKVECLDCGCTIRMTRKWLDEIGPPTCACGGQMAENGQEEND
jgi:hypothetical protein